VAHINWNLTKLAELELDEEGTRISLTIVDTPGFGDQIDNEARYDYTTRAPNTPSLANITCLAASQRLSATLRDNMMIFWPRSRVSSVTPDSGTTVSTPCSTSSPPLVTGMSTLKSYPCLASAIANRVAPALQSP
jgi:hypothetical protein